MNYDNQNLKKKKKKKKFGPILGFWGVKENFKKESGSVASRRFNQKKVSRYSLKYIYIVLPRLWLCFCGIVTQILKMTQPKLSPRDIWRTLIFGLSQDFESICCVENSHAKNNFFFTRIPVVVTAVLDF